MVATAAAVNHHPGGLFFRPFFSAADGWRAPAVLTGYKPGTSPQNCFFLLRLLLPERGEQTRARGFFSAAALSTYTRPTARTR